MKSHPNLIGLIGRKGSGKDTAALTLLSKGYQNVKFAGALKQMARSLLTYQGMDEATVERIIEGDMKEVALDEFGGRSSRYVMQTLGTEWGRNLISDSFWVDIAVNKALSRKTVVTDVRFPNEVAAIQDNGGVVFGISAEWIVPVEGEHESERLIDGLIAELPESCRIINKRGEPGYEAQAIQEFQRRFLFKLDQL